MKTESEATRTATERPPGRCF